MAKDYIGYQALTDAALRGVVRDALRRVEAQGLIGSHHFFITFKTQFPGVDIPDFLREQYPDQMGVIIQHQFWGLKVREDRFEVTLSFKKLPATLTIPFAALTAFEDKGVQFGLQFKEAGDTGKSAPTPVAQDGVREIGKDAGKELGKEFGKPAAVEAVKDEPKPAAPGEVVSLDAFRKK